jgi:glycosyltransferase involved in cell wall biosynthesis
VDIALFHHFPMIGGAPRVLAEYVTRSPQHDFTLYTRQPEREGLIALDERVRVRRFASLPDATAVDRFRVLWQLPRYGRELAAAIDGARHDAVFCHASFLVQAPEVLPYLRTPTLYYAPEPLRALYEPPPAFGRDDSLRARLVRWGLDPYERRRKALDRRHIRSADQVVTHSEFTAQALRNAYGVQSHVVPLGVDAEAFRPSASGSEGFVLSVGALHPLKGHDFVIEALATLPAPRPQLVVVGDRGGLEPQLADLASARGVELQIRRGVPFPELVDLYGRAGVVACGNVREPFGLTTLEAMAAGAPVVAVAEGGFLETLDDGRTGLLAPRDPGRFGEALARVLADATLAGRLSAEGRAEALRWSWQRTAAGFDALLRRAAAAERDRIAT